MSERITLREALVIGFAILVIGSAWIFVEHRDRTLVHAELARIAQHTETQTEERALDEALRRAPDDVAARLELAELLADAGDTPRARAHLVVVQALWDTLAPTRAAPLEARRAALEARLRLR